MCWKDEHPITKHTKEDNKRRDMHEWFPQGGPGSLSCATQQCSYSHKTKQQPPQGQGDNNGGGGGEWVGDQQAGLFAKARYCSLEDTFQSVEVLKPPSLQTDRSSYRPGATRRATLHACDHKKGSTTGLRPQEGQLNNRRHTAYCGHITTQQAVFTHLPVRPGKLLFLSSSSYKINKGD